MRIIFILSSRLKKKHISGSTPVVVCKAKLYKVHLISPLHCDQHIWKQTKNDSLRREIIDIFTKHKRMRFSDLSKMVYIYAVRNPLMMLWSVLVETSLLPGLSVGWSVGFGLSMKTGYQFSTFSQIAGLNADLMWRNRPGLAAQARTQDFKLGEALSQSPSAENY